MCNHYVENKQKLLHNAQRIFNDENMKQHFELWISWKARNDRKTGLSLLESLKSLFDLSFIVYGGASHCDGETIETFTFCVVIRLQLKVRVLNKQYLHGWGIEAFEFNLNFCSWNLFMNDNKEKSTLLISVLTESSCPMVTSSNILQYAIIYNTQRNITLKKSTHSSKETTWMYVASEVRGNSRAWLFLLPPYHTTPFSLLSSSCNGKDSNGEEMLYRATHVPNKKFKSFL